MISRVEEFYNEGAEYEWNRLERHPVEFEITRRHLQPFLKKKRKIADIGGGPGKYSFYYAQQGHSVTLVDLSKSNIEFAKRKSIELDTNLNGYHISSATDLQLLKDNHFDIILCFGPMYHLIEKSDHHKVLEECKRILKNNGILAMVFLTPWSHAFSSIENDPNKMTNLKEYFFSLVNSQKNCSNKDIDFPNGWNPKPENIIGMMESYYFSTEIIVPIEGPFGRLFEKIQDELDKKTYDNWIDYIYRLSFEKSLLGSCEHILYIGRKMK